MSFFGKWTDKITHYLEVRLNLIKLGLIERVSSVLSYLIFVFIGLFLSVSVLIFLGIGVGEYLSVLFDSRAGGFFATAGLYILLVIVMVLLRTPITNAFAGVFVRILTSSDREDDNDEKKQEEIKVE